MCMKLLRRACCLLLLCMASCTEDDAAGLLPRFGEVKEIHFVTQRGSDLEMVAVVNATNETATILSSIHIGREQPFSKHIFTKTLVLVKLDGSTIRIPFEDRNGLMSIRFGSKQYQTDRQTIDLLNRYYSAKVKETP